MSSHHPAQGSILLFTAFVSMLAAPALALAQEAPGTAGSPAARAIPGITTDDPFPGGCVDCHVYRPDEDLDVRISTLMRAWYDSVGPDLLERAQVAMGPDAPPLEGRHPRAERSLDDIPDGCMRCHRRDAVEAPPFARLMHSTHLVGGEENVFLSMFQGECTYCHKLEPATGQWSLASGPEPAVP